MSKTTIGLTRDASRALVEIGERFGFREDRDVAHLALAYALKIGLPSERTPDLGAFGGGGNKTWSTAAFDRSVERLVLVFHPTADDPLVALETLITRGLLEMNARFESGALGELSDLLE